MAGGYIRSGLVLAGLAALFAAAVCLADEPNRASPSEANLTQPEQEKARTLREVAHNWIQVGISQYKRGLYPEAEKSFLTARDCQEYLTAEENKELEEHLTKAHQAGVERQAALKHIQQAKDLLNKGQPIQARTHYEKASNSPFLTDQERKQIVREIKTVDETLDRQRKEITGLYNRSVELYRAGNLDKAREGFVEVARYGMLVVPKGQSAEDYLVQIDNVLAERLRDQLSAGSVSPPIPSAAAPPVSAKSGTGPQAESQPLQPGPEQQPTKKQLGAEQQPENLPEELAEVAAAAEPVTQKQVEASHAENARTKIILAYTKAVVDDTALKVGYYIGRREFNRAVDAVRAASEIVSENRSLIGEELFTQHTIRLKQLASKIIQASKTS